MPDFTGGSGDLGPGQDPPPTSPTPADRPCASCTQVITEEQRTTLAGLLMDQGYIGEGKWRARAILIAEVVPGSTWSSDLGVLSQQQADDLIRHLEAKRDEQRGS